MALTTVHAGGMGFGSRALCGRARHECGCDVQGIVLPTAPAAEPLAFPAVAALHAHYTPGSWDASAGVWRDVSGNERHSVAISGSISKAAGAGHGAAGNISYLTGGPGDWIEFPDFSLPYHFTVCSLSRYTSVEAASQQRIVTCSNLNWAHGHDAGHAGTSRYYSVLPVTSATTVDDASGWVVMCGQNRPAGGERSYQLANGVDVWNADGGDGNCQLSVNKAVEAEAYDSGFAVHGITVWHRHLSFDEMRNASALYLQHLAVADNASEVRVRARARVRGDEAGKARVTLRGFSRGLGASESPSGRVPVRALGCAERGRG